MTQVLCLFTEKTEDSKAPPWESDEFFMNRFYRHPFKGFHSICPCFFLEILAGFQFKLLDFNASRNVLEISIEIQPKWKQFDESRLILEIFKFTAKYFVCFHDISLFFDAALRMAVKKNCFLITTNPWRLGQFGKVWVFRMLKVDLLRPYLTKKLK